MQTIGNEMLIYQRSPKSPTSPANSNENEKNRRYDRQLRLWGENGQNNIESSKVCLINASATGTELIKSLVLSGIGSFTIIDDNKISSQDDNNFFFDKNSIGKSKAEVSTILLREMNPEVHGDYLEDSIETLLETNQSNVDLFSKFSVIIATNIHNERTIVKLSQLLWDLNVPLILCYSIGFVGLIRVQIREHPIIESHPDNALEDLRLDRPFQELKEYLESNCKFEKLNRQELSHIPYLVIIYKYLKIWQCENQKENNWSGNHKEKEQLKALIKKGMESVKSSLTEKDGIDLDLENFEEAIKAVNKIMPSNYLPLETRRILDDPNQFKVLSNDLINSQFWLMIRALKDFIKEKNNGCLPVRGSIPDMIANTESYISLQKIYSAKAKEDSELVYSCLQSICNEINKPLDFISENQVKTLCKNSHCIRLIRTTPIWAEYIDSKDKPNKTYSHLRELVNSSDFNGDENNDLIFYLMLRSINRFYTQFNRFPGYYDDQVESDIIILKVCFKDILNELGCNNLSKDDFIHEMCRYGGAELHSIAAFIGGCAAQEVIKFITKQFVPLNSTFIYNAMSSTTITFDWLLKDLEDK